MSGWLFDLPGLRYVTNALNTVFPQRQTLRFLGGASVVDNSTLATTDITVASASYRWTVAAAPGVAANRFPVSFPDLAAGSYAPESLGQQLVTAAFTATYFAFLCSNAALATDSLLCVVRQNGIDTALTFTIPAGTGLGVVVADAAHSVAFARGDKIGVRLLQSGATAQPVWAGSFQVG